MGQHPGHDREEGRPQRVATAADLAAAHRVAARAREAREGALEGGSREAAAAAPAASTLDEGATIGGYRSPERASSPWMSERQEVACGAFRSSPLPNAIHCCDL